jgi:hypothetical protein
LGVYADEKPQEKGAMRRGKRILPIPKGKPGFQGPHPEVRVRGSIAHTATLGQVKISVKKSLLDWALFFKAQRKPVASQFC